MSEGGIWWVVEFTLNLIDFTMVYVIMHAFLKRRITFNIGHLTLAFLYVSILVAIGYFNQYVARFSSIVSLILLIKIIGRRGISDSLTIYGLAWVLVSMIQTLTLGIVGIICDLLDLYQPVVFLIVHLITILGVIFICKTFKLSQWFYALQVHVVLKLILSVLFLICWVVAFILNFESQLSYLLFFTMAIISIGIVLFPILMQLYYNSIGIISLHDLKNSLLSTAIAMKQTNNPEEILNLFARHSKEFGIDVSQLEMTKVDDELDYMDKMNKEVEQFILMKIKAHKKEVEIISDLTYYEPNDAIDFQLALKLLGTLLDNALEASSHNPIYVHLFSMSEEFKLKMANEFFGKEGQDINVIFEKGYTKKENGRGIGLNHLHQIVVEKGGRLEVDEYYTEAHHCYYLQIDIRFKK